METQTWTDIEVNSDLKTMNLCLNDDSGNLKTQLKLEENNDKVFTVENCALGLLNLAYPISNQEFDSSDIFTDFSNRQSILCAACKPKYKPEFIDNEKQFVSSCLFIDDCKNSDWVNACS